MTRNATRSATKPDALGTSTVTREESRRPARRSATKVRPPKYRRGEGSAWLDESRLDGRGAYVLDHLVGGKRYRERGDSWAEVEEMRDLRRDDVDRRSRLADDGTTTVVEAFAAWLELDAPTLPNGKAVAPGTLRNMEDALRTLAASPIAETPLVDLRAGDVEAVLVALSKRKVRPHGRSSLAKLRSYLVRAIDRAVRLDLVESNVVRSTRVPASAATRRREASWLDRDGFVAMREELGAAHASNYDRALLVSLLTGCRPGEALGLRWSAVDFDARTIVVRSGLQVDRTGRKREVVDELKTKTATRVLEMPDDLVVALRREHAAQAKRRLASTSWEDETLVFASETGRPLNPSNLRRAAARVCAALDLPRVTPNELRHSFASVALDLGFPMPAVARALGHRDTRMVATTYGHSLDAVVPTGAALDAMVRSA